MPRTPFDPLNMIPSPEAIRERLAEAEALARRLQVLLDVAVRLRGEKAVTTPDTAGEGRR